jgi:uncharacterized protein YprB with RNaseH-like and TPR domain
MLRSTFCHIPGVGLKTEQRLWSAGITSWEAVLGPGNGRGVRAAGRLDTALLRESQRHYEGSNPAWFGERLPPGQVWRLFHDFRGSCAYLDIETTGLSNFGHITTIALYDGRTIRHYVHGDNLEQFPHDVRDYRLLVTYNGKSFDLPFIERCLGARLGQAHIDLRYVLKSLGLRGGLKGCERQMGLERPGMEEVDGFVAVLLWHEFRRNGNERALESLLAYNVQDAVNLEMLMVLAYNRKLAELAGAPFTAGYRLPAPASPPNPFRVDAATVYRVLREYPWPRPFPG